MDKNDYLFPQSRYQGQFKLQNIAFDANLQELAQWTSYICALHTGGQMSTEEAFERLEQLWHVLSQSKRNLEI